MAEVEIDPETGVLELLRYVGGGRLRHEFTITSWSRDSFSAD